MSRGFSVCHRAVAEQHAGNERRIDAVVAAPCLGVGVEDRLGRPADRRLPRDAVAALVADDQVGRVVLVRPAVHLRGDVRPLDGAFTVFRVDQIVEPAGDLLAEPVGLVARLDDSLRVLVLEVDDRCRPGRWRRRGSATSRRRPGAPRRAGRRAASGSRSPRASGSGRPRGGSGPKPWSEMTISSVSSPRHFAIVLPTRSSMRR